VQNMRLLILASAGVAGLSSGCINPAIDTLSHLVQTGDARNGVTYYVGGAGQFGHSGSLSVPQGLQEGGYRGVVHVFPWQSLTVYDQVALERNRAKAAELADLVKRQKRRHPDVPVNIIALSAGTGIATFALERLPEDVKVHAVVFLSSSLSSRYDLTRALKRVEDGLYVFHSRDDEVLAYGTRIAGTVDRRDPAQGVAGLHGFRLPRTRDESVASQYAKLHNVRHRAEFSAAGYVGGHTDATSREFIARHVAPLLFQRVTEPVGEDESEIESSSLVRVEADSAEKEDSASE